MGPEIYDLLTDAELRFATHLAATGDRTAAAMAANPGTATPERDALRYLANPNVDAYLTFLHQEASSRGAQPLSDHLFDLATVRALGEEKLKLLLTRAGPGDAAAAASMFASVLRAVELRGKASNLYVERKEVSGPNGTPVQGAFRVEWE